MHTSEEWRPVIWTNGKYEVSSRGRLRSLFYANQNGVYFGADRGKQIKGIPTGGYLRVGFRINGRRVGCSIHRLVAEAFVPNPENKPEVNHKNGIKDDNRVENLEWVTARENTRHALRLSLRETARGERHGRAKLTENDVREIRRRYALKEGSGALAAEFGVDRCQIWDIATRRCWRHVA